MLSCLTEFNEEVFRKGIREEGYMDGCSDTRKEDIIKAIQMLKDLSASKEHAIQQLMEKYELSQTEAAELVNLHWK